MGQAFECVGDIMSTVPFWLSANEPLERAAGLLLRESHSGCPVCDESGTVVGVLSEIDLVRALAPVVQGQPIGGQVKDYMTSAPVMLQPEMSLGAAAQFFVAIPVRRAPIVSRNGKLVGVCSRRDVLMALVANARRARLTTSHGR